MSFSINPLTFQTDSLATKSDQRKFLYKLSSLLSQMTAAIVQPSGTTTVALGSLSSNHTVDCTNAGTVSITFTFNAAMTLTLSNLGNGVPVSIACANTNAGTIVLKIAAINPLGTSYTTVSFFSGGAQTNLITSGWSAATGSNRVFFGISNGLLLQMAFI